jgi:transposase
MSEKLMVGVDMAKRDFAAAVQMEEVVEELGTFANDAGGRQSLQEQLKTLGERQGTEEIHLIVEATGGYEAALVAYAHEQEWLVSMPNPKQVRDWARGVGYRAKTDRVDARILAHYGKERNPPIRPPLAREVSQLDSLLKRRLDLEQA